MHGRIKHQLQIPQSINRGNAIDCSFSVCSVSGKITSALYTEDFQGWLVGHPALDNLNSPEPCAVGGITGYALRVAISEVSRTTEQRECICIQGRKAIVCMTVPMPLQIQHGARAQAQPTFRCNHGMPRKCPYGILMRNGIFQLFLVRMLSSSLNRNPVYVGLNSGASSP